MRSLAGRLGLEGRVLTGAGLTAASSPARSQRRRSSPCPRCGPSRWARGHRGVRRGPARRRERHGRDRGLARGRGQRTRGGFRRPSPSRARTCRAALQPGAPACHGPGWPQGGAGTVSGRAPRRAPARGVRACAGALGRRAPLAAGGEQASDGRGGVLDAHLAGGECGAARTELVKGAGIGEHPGEQSARACDVGATTRAASASMRARHVWGPSMASTGRPEESDPDSVLLREEGPSVSANRRTSHAASAFASSWAGNLPLKDSASCIRLLAADIQLCPGGRVRSGSADQREPRLCPATADLAHGVEHEGHSGPLVGVAEQSYHGALARRSARGVGRRDARGDRRDEHRASRQPPAGGEPAGAPVGGHDDRGERAQQLDEDRTLGHRPGEAAKASASPG